MTISGVTGTVVRTGPGTGATGGTFTFTRSSAGTAVNSPEDASVTVNNGNLNSGFVIFWVGEDNFSEGNQVLSDVAAMVQSLPSPKHFLILSIVNGYSIPREEKGGSYYKEIIAINNSLATRYPHNYLDARALLVSHYDPSIGEDVYDNSLDIPPASTRAFTIFGQLQTVIPDNTSCGFEVTSGATIVRDTMMIESERIEILSTATAQDGNTVVQTCTRGFGGTTATPHATGLTVTGRDWLHPNGLVGSEYVAGQVNAWILAHDPPH